ADEVQDLLTDAGGALGDVGNLAGHLANGLGALLDGVERLGNEAADLVEQAHDLTLFRSVWKGEGTNRFSGSAAKGFLPEFLFFDPVALAPEARAAALVRGPLLAGLELGLLELLVDAHLALGHLEQQLGR